MITLLATTIVVLNSTWTPGVPAWSLHSLDPSAPIRQDTKRKTPKPHPDVQKLIDQAIAEGVANDKRTKILQQALSLARKLKDRPGEFGSLFYFGVVYNFAGDRNRALDFYGRSLIVAQELVDREAQGTILFWIGSIHNDLGHLSKALQFYEQSQTIQQEVGDRKGEGTTLYNMAMLLDARGDYKKALKVFERSLLIRQEINDRTDLGDTLNFIGLVHIALGNATLAMEFFERALSIRREDGDLVGEGTTLSNIGLVFANLGDRKRALEYDKRALAILERIGEPARVGRILDNMGLTLVRLGDHKLALQFFERALTVQHNAGIAIGEASTLESIGSLHYILRKFNLALEFFERALAIRKKVNDRLGEGSSLSAIGDTYSVLGDHARALKFYEQALTRYRELGHRAGEWNTLKLMGLMLGDQGDRERALEFLLRALVISRDVGEREGEANILLDVGLLHEVENRRNLAIIALKQSVNVLQSLRKDAKGLSDDLQKLYKVKVKRTYESLADLLVREGRLAEAQQVLDLLKDDELFGFVRRRGVLEERGDAVTLTKPEAEWVARYDKIAGEVGDLGQRYGALLQKDRAGGTNEKEKAQLAEMAKDLQAVRKRFQTFLSAAVQEFAKIDPKQNIVEDVKNTASLMKTLKTLSQTGPRTVALYTATAEDRLHIIITTPELQDVVTIDIKAEDLRTKIFAFREILQRPDLDPRPLGNELYDLIVKPLEAKLGKNPTAWLWSLDGALRYLPIGALWDGERYLVERQAMSVIAPAGQSDLTAAPDAWKTLAFATSRPHDLEVYGAKLSFTGLPGTVQELAGIGKQVTTESYPDEQFTSAAFFEKLRKGGFPAVHIATHFYFRAGFDDTSFLLLGDGKPLMFSEVSDKVTTGLFDGVELLTLSACETALSSEANGRDFEGFAALAQRAGVRSVLATLWKVSDPSTAALMARFYANRGENPKATKADALRQAQLAMIRGELTTPSRAQPERSGSATAGAKAPEYPKNLPAYSHPYYWAPFVLIGNPR